MEGASLGELLLAKAPVRRAPSSFAFARAAPVAAGAASTKAVAGVKRPRPESFDAKGRKRFEEEEVEEDEREDDDEEDGGDGEESDGDGAPRKKRSKHAPVELSTKFPPKMKKVKHGPVARDPRFEATAGTFNEDLFRRSYKFVDEVRDNEISELTKAVKKAKSAEDKEELKGVLTHLKQTRADVAQTTAVREARQEVKRKERAAVSEGKLPYFPKKREQKELEATVRYARLEATGGAAAVDRAIAKRRKKAATKERKWMPRAGVGRAPLHVRR